jgi:hypothetical protein
VILGGPDLVTLPPAVPEPATWIMMLTSLGVLGPIGWRRKRKNAASLAAA